MSCIEGESRNRGEMWGMEFSAKYINELQDYRPNDQRLQIMRCVYTGVQLQRNEISPQFLKKKNEVDIEYRLMSASNDIKRSTPNCNCPLPCNGLAQLSSMWRRMSHQVNSWWRVRTGPSSAVYGAKPPKFVHMIYNYRI